MATELKRGVIRIVSNYGRMGLTLLMGIIIVPVFISGVGTEAFGLYSLLGSTFGIAQMCKTIVSSSMVRELGAAYHSADPEEFPNVFNSALVLSAAMAALTASIFVCVWFLLPAFSIPPDLAGAARWLVVTQGAYSTLEVLVGPIRNMYAVSERMVLLNTWATLSRATDVVAAVVLFLILGINDPGLGLTLFAIGSALGSVAVLLIAISYIIKLDRRLIPRPSRINRASLGKIMPTAGWNTMVVTATNLHIRIDQIIMNLFFGVMGNAIFALAVRLTSYVRLIASGGTIGLDVVSARLSTRETGMSVGQLLHHATRMHAAVALPAGMLVLLFTEPLLTYWVGRAVGNPDTIREAVVLAQILVIGMTVRGIADCWTGILYGSGHVHRYAPLVLVGGLCNPVLAVALIAVLPAGIAFKGPAIAFAAVLTIVHFMMIPIVAARCLSIRFVDVFAPLVRPGIAAGISSLVLVGSRTVFGHPSFAVLIATLALFGLVHAALCWFFVLGQTERARFSKIIASRTGYQIPMWAQA